MKKISVIILSLMVTVSCLNAQGLYPTNWEYYTQLEMRRQVILSALAGQSWMEGDDLRRRIYLAGVKIYTGIDRDTGLQYLWDAVNHPHPWGSFNVYSCMDLVLRIGHLIPPQLIQKIKVRLALSFSSYKGFTENHKLQYRTARYLFGQTWPTGPTFKDGSTPSDGKAEAEHWINDWIARTVSVGMMEYDSVNYHSLYLLCINTLFDFAQDSLMKRKAWMMMHLLLADWAPEYLEGNWVGAHSREKYDQVIHTKLNCGTAIPFGYLFFGNSQYFPEIPEPYYVGLAAVQNFKPLALVGNIATDRRIPYIHRETKAPRRGFGISESELPIWKYTYVTKSYALGSSYGDLTAVENHRWDLTWTSKKDGSTCFFINPSYSAKQLLKYFDSTPKEIIPEIVRQRPYYKDPNKWVEGSPYEDLFQHKNTIIALYNIPKDEVHTHVNGFFPKIIQERKTDPSGWIFCRTDSIYFAVKPLTKPRWIEENDHYRLKLVNPKTGILMEVAQQADYLSFENFKQQIKKNPLKIDKKILRVTYTNSEGDCLDFRFGKRRLLNGEEIRFEDWPLFSGPFINSSKGSKIITLQHNREKIILNFNNFSVEMEPPQTDIN
jgi:hypothetical protein